MKVLLVLLTVTISLALGAKLKFEPRIYNGENAKPGQFPYIVSLLIDTGGMLRKLCGGSIIDHTWILTAAHCTHEAKSVTIFYGSTKQLRGQFSHKVNAVDIFQHKHFNYITPENDIALIRTPHVDFSDLVNKVALADRDNDYEGSWAVASGWGDTFDGSGSAKDLQFADFQIKSKEECRNAINHAFDNILCVSTLHNKYTGNGDSGGPLVTRDDPKLVGVTSFGLEADGETVEHSPEFFCPVSAYRDWIRNHTGIE